MVLSHLPRLQILVSGFSCAAALLIAVTNK
jgi:hypothetical protein